MDSRDPHSGPAAAIGVVLAGGDSQRMGRDKAGIVIGGETLVERAARRLGDLCSSVVIANDGRRRFEEYACVRDGAGQGPAAGILGAASAYPARALLVLACDLPDVPGSLLSELLASPADWTVPRWQGRLEPLCALYRPPALEALAGRVAAGSVAPHRLAEEAQLVVRFLEGSELDRHGAPDRVFANLNRPEDLDRFEHSL